MTTNRVAVNKEKHGMRAGQALTSSPSIALDT